MEPLTLTDARHPATVARWVQTWLDGGGTSVPLVRGGLLWVSIDHAGVLETWDTPTTSTRHADRAALVAYVVAWARGTL